MTAQFIAHECCRVLLRRLSERGIQTSRLSEDEPVDHSFTLPLNADDVGSLPSALSLLAETIAASGVRRFRKMPDTIGCTAFDSKTGVSAAVSYEPIDHRFYIRLDGAWPQGEAA